VRKAFRQVVDEIPRKVLPFALCDDAAALVVTHFLRRNDAVAEHGRSTGVVDVDGRARDVGELDTSGLRRPDIRYDISIFHTHTFLQNILGQRKIDLLFDLSSNPS